MYTDCKDALTQGQTTSGVYTINPDNQTAFQAYCDMVTDGGGWTVFQHREDGSVDFYRNWTDYQQGFGNLSGEFWLGLDKIHRLTSTATQLRIDMQDFKGNSRYAQYLSFSVGDSVSKYTLSVSGYSGTAGDSFTVHTGSKFTTRDQNNDRITSFHCAQAYRGAWWYYNCHESNLNGLYHGGSHSSYADGVNWYHWRGYYYSLKFTEMKLRKNWTPEYFCWCVHSCLAACSHLQSRGHSYQIARSNATLVGWLFLPSGKNVLGVAIWYLQGF